MLHQIQKINKLPHSFTSVAAHAARRNHSRHGIGEFGFCHRVADEYPYEKIPHFPRSTAIGHRGQLVCGTLGGLPSW